ncbi:MAG: DedA family protein, partial [Bacteroidales bacterium]
MLITDPSILLWLKETVAIFFLTFLHEDAAIVAAGFAKVERGLPLLYAYLPVYIGIVAGDVLIYGMGRLAQTNRWLRSKIIGPKVEKVKSWLEIHLVRVLVVCRLTPGLLFPTFVACGWFRIPFWRFAAVSIMAGAVYSSIILTMVILFGDLVLYHLGYWSWGILTAVVIIFAVRNSFKSGWSKKTEHVMGEVPPTLVKTLKRYIPSMKRKFIGMPSLDDLKKFVSTAEKIPNNILYIPIGLRWLWLALKYRSLTLPSVSNPMIETGGFMGESKASVLDMVGKDAKEWLAEYILFHNNDAGVDKNFQRALEAMKEKGIDFPVVVKPDIGWNGYGVRFI